MSRPLSRWQQSPSATIKLCPLWRSLVLEGGVLWLSLQASPGCPCGLTGCLGNQAPSGVLFYGSLDHLWFRSLHRRLYDDTIPIHPLDEFIQLKPWSLFLSSLFWTRVDITSCTVLWRSPTESLVMQVHGNLSLPLPHHSPLPPKINLPPRALPLLLSSLNYSETLKTFYFSLHILQQSVTYALAYAGALTGDVEVKKNKVGAANAIADISFGLVKQQNISFQDFE